MKNISIGKCISDLLAGNSDKFAYIADRCEQFIMNGNNTEIVIYNRDMIMIRFRTKGLNKRSPQDNNLFTVPVDEVRKYFELPF